ncbi:MAG: aspartate--tRNA ligase [Mycoplasma sp.]|nr:aspartate--tRNA ligase [Mycoplasma sp.]
MIKKIKNTSLSKKNINEKVELFGFVSSKRNLGQLTFIDLRDESGIIQLVFEKNKFESLKKESVIQVSGKVVERKDYNNNLETGEIEIIVENLVVLSKPTVDELPFEIKEEITATEDTRLKSRFMDLRRSRMKKNLKIRYRLIKSIRDFLDEKEFTEIETPLLSKSTPEGARDFLVPSRKDGFFALPQSPQMYKQLLICSGFEKYFQIARVFRDEDSRADRQPEFTQLDLEMAYTNEESIMNMMNDMFLKIMKDQKLDVSNISFPTMEFDDAIEYYGTDKPDIRYEYKMIDATNYFDNTTFNAFKNKKSIKFIIFDEEVNKKQIKKLTEVAIKNGASGLLTCYVDVENNENTSKIYSLIKKEVDKIIEDFSIKKSSTLLFVADEYDVTTKSLGAVRVELNNIFKLAKQDDYKFLWVVNWPLFEKEDQNLSPMHHVFTSPKDLDFSKANDQEYLSNLRARSYDLVLNGYEIGGGSIRIHDLETQNKMFEIIGISEERRETEFGFFLNAFNYGVPPMGGIAFGIDRIAMILSNTNSIREVIAFPKNSNGLGVLEKSPSEISDEQIEEYNIKLISES